MIMLAIIAVLFVAAFVSQWLIPNRMVSNDPRDIAE